MIILITAKLSVGCGSDSFAGCSHPSKLNRFQIVKIVDQLLLDALSRSWRFCVNFIFFISSVFW